MKRRILALLAALVLLLSLTACGGDSSAGDSGQADAKTQEPEAPVESTGGEDESGTGGSTESGGKMEQSGTLGDYAVAIKGATLATDYEGNPAIIITYSWTNNSEETTSDMASMMGKAFQDGVQLDTAIIMDVDGYDSEASMKDVRPGTTIDIQCAYLLTSETSVVEFELTEFMSFSDDMVTMNFDPASL